MNQNPNQGRDRGLLFSVLGRLFKPLEGRLWLSAASLVFLTLMGVTTFHLWTRHSDKILSQPQYRLNPDLLQVTPQPEYIRSDVKANAVINGQLKDANLLEERIVLQVRQAFAVQPWVKEVLYANKQYPSTVEVELVYRRPIAMVEIPPGTLEGIDYPSVLPIDDEAVLLPVEITEAEARKFPKIGGVNTAPAGPPGSPWGDTRIAEATQIVMLLEDIWDQLELHRIEVPPRTSSVNQPESEEYQLVSKSRQRYSWGPALGKELPGEPSGKELAKRLRKAFEKTGMTIDELYEHDGNRRNREAQHSVSELLNHHRFR